MSGNPNVRAPFAGIVAVIPLPVKQGGFVAAGEVRLLQLADLRKSGGPRFC